MNENLVHLEREVEIARARLSTNLSTLFSADTYAAFKDDLKDEARSTLSQIVENVKARAAANPAAALAIGAGLTWRLVQRPPITAALIGAGIVSLLRTTPIASNGDSKRNYYSEGKNRLRQQAGELADTVKDQAVEMAGDIKEHASELAATAADKVADAVAAVKEKTASLSHGATQTVENGWFSADVDEIAQSGTQDSHSALNDPDVRDKFLIGLAGVAVAAALGIAYQRAGQSAD